jgi:hypothetical protein
LSRSSCFGDGQSCVRIRGGSNSGMTFQHVSAHTCAVTSQRSHVIVGSVSGVGGCSTSSTRSAGAAKCECLRSTSYTYARYRRVAARRTPSRRTARHPDPSRLVLFEVERVVLRTPAHVGQLIRARDPDTQSVHPARRPMTSRSSALPDRCAYRGGGTRSDDTRFRPARYEGLRVAHHWRRALS